MSLAGNIRQYYCYLLERAQGILNLSVFLLPPPILSIPLIVKLSSYPRGGLTFSCLALLLSQVKFLPFTLIWCISLLCFWGFFQKLGNSFSSQQSNRIDSKSCSYFPSGLKRIEEPEIYCLPFSYLCYVTYMLYLISRLLLWSTH